MAANMPIKHKKKHDYGMVGPVGLNIISVPAMHTSCPPHPQAQAISGGIADSSGHPGGPADSGSNSAPSVGSAGPAGGSQ